jgi:hypothetical protein
MPDIPQPSGLAVVETRPDGRGPGGGALSRPPRRVAETYQETERASPADEDRITILGIPMEQITASTRAALAGLVAENATLRAQVRRLEARNAASLPILERDGFIARLGELLAGAPGPGSQWVLALVHLQTYDDIRRSTGLLAANSALADVGQRLRNFHLTAPAAEDAPVTAPAIEVPTVLIGSVGGVSMGILFVAPQGVDTTAMAKAVRDGIAADGYDVAGLSMALAFKVAAVTVSPSESALLAIARVDHPTRGPQAVG